MPKLITSAPEVVDRGRRDETPGDAWDNGTLIRVPT